ncbi:hypothetical protein BU25DRAFT_105350 [Macroventuria anomochaeta]|uniref:Uncharacterized protein n=1 Tax=Macroventuria anomochaeta TaxID=301207 RepID=A0ACB6RVH8_9PLEO|nr:uncharacterized protein BU25DRAFT_105350 [Macroventuria anomochaeta]KAF2625891.1 hypothetical protein BU25DRAFT_105350 [Macroventuria anomochaeta]
MCTLFVPCLWRSRMYCSSDFLQIISTDALAGPRMVPSQPRQLLTLIFDPYGRHERSTHKTKGAKRSIERLRQEARSGGKTLPTNPEDFTTEAKAKVYYQLDISELICLSYLVKPRGDIGRSVKVSRRQDVKVVLYCRIARLAGIQEGEVSFSI